MRAKTSWLDRFDQALQVTLALLFMALFLATMLNIVLRNIGGIAWLWIPGFNRLVFIWLVFIGITVAYRRAEHLQIDLLLRRLPERARHGYSVVLHLLMMPFFVVLAYWGQVVARQRMRISFETWDVPTGYAYAAVPITACFLLIFAVEHIVHHLKEVRTS